MNLHSCTYRCPVTDAVLLDALIGAGIGAGATAGIDALTGQPVTWKGEAIGAGLGAATAGTLGYLDAPAAAAGGGGGAGWQGATLASAEQGTAAAGAGAAGGGLAPLTSAGISAGGGGLSDAAVNASVQSMAAGDWAGVSGMDAGSALASGANAGMLPEVTVSGAAVPSGAALSGDIATSAIAPSLLASTQPAQVSMKDVAPGIPADATAPAGGGTPLDTGGAPPWTGQEGFQPGGGYVPPEMGSTDVADPTWWDQMASTLKTPRGMLTAGSLGANLFGILSRPQLPGAAKTALGAAGPAVQNATMIIQTGGMGSPLWTTQKASIDAQINQQIANATRAIEQSGVNSGMGGSNSAAIQEQIASMTAQMNTQRQTMYTQAQQQIVNNAISELTGANSTLMQVAQLQFQENQAQQALAHNIASTTGSLAALWPSSNSTS